MNTFIIVKIAPSLENSLENKSMLLVHFKKDLLSLYLGTHLTEELLTDYCFVLNYHRIPYYYIDKVNRGQ